MSDRDEITSPVSTRRTSGLEFKAKLKMSSQSRPQRRANKRSGNTGKDLNVNSLNNMLTDELEGKRKPLPDNIGELGIAALIGSGRKVIDKDTVETFKKDIVEALTTFEKLGGDKEEKFPEIFSTILTRWKFNKDDMLAVKSAIFEGIGKVPDDSLDEIMSDWQKTLDEEKSLAADLETQNVLLDERKSDHMSSDEEDNKDDEFEDAGSGSQSELMVIKELSGDETPSAKKMRPPDNLFGASGLSGGKRFVWTAGLPKRYQEEAMDIGESSQSQKEQRQPITFQDNLGDLPDVVYAVDGVHYETPEFSDQDPLSEYRTHIKDLDAEIPLSIVKLLGEEPSSETILNHIVISHGLALTISKDCSVYEAAIINYINEKFDAIKNDIKISESRIIDRINLTKKQIMIGGGGSDIITARQNSRIEQLEKQLRDLSITVNQSGLAASKGLLASAAKKPSILLAPPAPLAKKAPAIPQAKAGCSYTVNYTALEKGMIPTLSNRRRTIREAAAEGPEALKAHARDLQGNIMDYFIVDNKKK